MRAEQIRPQRHGAEQQTSAPLLPPRRTVEVGSTPHRSAHRLCQPRPAVLSAPPSSGLFLSSRSVRGTPVQARFGAVQSNAENPSFHSRFPQFCDHFVRPRPVCPAVLPRSSAGRISAPYSPVRPSTAQHRHSPSQHKTEQGGTNSSRARRLGTTPPGRPIPSLSGRQRGCCAGCWTGCCVVGYRRRRSRRRSLRCVSIIRTAIHPTSVARPGGRTVSARSLPAAVSQSVSPSGGW